MGKRKRKLSLQALRVLNLLTQNPGATLCGANLIKELKISSGSIYPILLRLEKNGLVRSSWETESASSLGRPRRRLYEVTGKGVKAAEKALAEFEKPSFKPSWT